MLKGFKSYLGGKEEDQFRDAARRRIREERLRDERWNVLAGSAWLCPYCGEIGVPSIAQAEDVPGAILTHFMGGCPGWRRFSGEPWEAKRLRGRAVFLEALKVLRDALPTDPRFYRREDTGRWCCPFCVGETEVEITAAKRVDGAVLSRMAAHLASCPAFQEGPPREKGEIDEAVAERDRARRIARDIREIPRFASWQRTDLAGRWHCPFCAEPLILPAAAEPLTSTSNLKAVEEHLLSCEPYGKGAASRDPLKEVEFENRKHALSSRIRKLIAQDPRWTKADDYCYWICPSCQEAIPSINMGDADRMEKEVPIRIAQHLMADCPKFDERTLRLEQGPRADEGQSRERKSLLDELQDLKKESESHKDLDRTLADARRIQLMMLPPAPVIPGFEFQCFYKPCLQLGGDFYDFVHLDDGRLGITIGDVSGHGIDSALVMSVVKKLIQVYGRAETDPIRPLVLTNREVCRELEPSIFITILYGILDPARRTFDFARAGHTALLRANASAPVPLTEWNPRGMAVGVDSGAIFEKTLDANRVTLSPGDVFLLSTDGLAEARTAEGEMFGEDRLKQLLLRTHHRPLADVFDEIERSVRAFSGREEMEDDITMVGFRVLE